MQSPIDQMYKHVAADDEDDDDDGDNWVPLEQQECPREPPVLESMANQPRHSPASSALPALARKPHDCRPGTRATNDKAPSLRTLQIKLETNTKLKEDLVDRPLDQAWQRFIIYLGRELWALDLQSRLGT